MRAVCSRCRPLSLIVRTLVTHSFSQHSVRRPSWDTAHWAAIVPVYRCTSIQEWVSHVSLRSFPTHCAGKSSSCVLIPMVLGVGAGLARRCGLGPAQTLISADSLSFPKQHLVVSHQSELGSPRSRVSPHPTVIPVTPWHYGIRAIARLAGRGVVCCGRARVWSLPWPWGGTHSCARKEQMDVGRRPDSVRPRPEELRTSLCSSGIIASFLRSCGCVSVRFVDVGFGSAALTPLWHRCENHTFSGSAGVVLLVSPRSPVSFYWCFTVVCFRGAASRDSVTQGAHGAQTSAG